MREVAIGYSLLELKRAHSSLKFAPFFMGKLIDLTGQVFGELTVMSFNGTTADNKALWNCKCSCGRMTVKRSKILRKGKELYCGNDHPTKVCTECKINKDKSEYHKCKSNPIGIASKCKECISNFYIKNRDNIIKKYHDSMKDENIKRRRQQINKKSRIKNYESQRRYKLIYDKTETVKQRKKIAHNKRKYTDTNYIIKRRLRWRIRDTVKRISGKGYKYESSLILLGCDINFFKTYLENKFVEGMGWHNIQEWHIDHIRPCSKFDLTNFEEQKKCFHYSNLQPLWCLDNLKKGTSYDNK